MNWLIIRTDARKEAFVARQVGLMGWPAWVPVQIITSRPVAARKVTAKAHLQTIKELPILPRRIFAAVPSWAVWQDELHGIQHYVGIERQADNSVVWVPDVQISAFRAEIDAVNTAALALSQRASRRQKTKWRDLKEALVEMIHGAKQTMESAA